MTVMSDPNTSENKTNTAAGCIAVRAERRESALRNRASHDAAVAEVCEYRSDAGSAVTPTGRRGLPMRAMVNTNS
jgi:hypothetical protein